MKTRSVLMKVKNLIAIFWVKTPCSVAENTASNTHCRRQMAPTNTCLPHNIQDNTTQNTRVYTPMKMCISDAKGSETRGKMLFRRSSTKIIHGCI